MPRLSNDDFRKLVNAPATSSSRTATSSDVHPRASGPKRSVLPSQSKTFERSGLDDTPTKQAQKRPQYRDRAQERRQAKEEDLAPTNISKGLDYELLARVRRGEDIYVSESVDRAEHYNYNADDDDDPELDKQLDEILMSNELDKKDVVSAENVTKSKAELLSELRRKIDEKPKSKFRPIGKYKSPGLEEERKADVHVKSKSAKNDKKKKEKKFKRPQMSEVPQVPQVSEVSEVSEGSEITSKDREPTQREDDWTPAVAPVAETSELQSDKHKVYTGLPRPADKAPGEDALDDGDIFEDAGRDYDPFAGIDDDDSLSDSKDDAKENSRKVLSPKESPKSSTGHPEALKPRRNYFGDHISLEPEPAKTETEHASEQSKSMMDIIAKVDLDTVLKNARAAKTDKTLGLVPLQMFGRDYDIDTDLGGEGRWIDDDEEDSIRKKSRKRKRA
ncbi:uncharacterized protein V1513DRAFT_427422 [Lipomyces chichibuensis]|uniref:uncharacterized protein n=1 Tax=Lipomyces chichibuensis TaxID=1546026 RepID=UPI0033430735